MESKKRGRREPAKSCKRTKGRRHPARPPSSTLTIREAIAATVAGQELAGPVLVSVADWKAYVGEPWRQTVGGVVETGYRLARAKRELTPSDYDAVARHLGLKHRAADMVITVGRDRRIASQG